MKGWVAAMFTSAPGRKYVMALTGLFLISFLVVHLGGNLLSLLPDGGLMFNSFSHFMTHNIIIRILEIVLFAGFIIHIAQSIVVTRLNQKARPEKYAVNAASANSSWISRNMGLLGSIIFIFLVIHLRNFYYESRFNEEALGLDANGHANLYRIVVATFTSLPYTLLYVIAVVALGYHLWHGFNSAFRSLGIMHSKYTPVIVFLGQAYTIIITGGFILIPVYWYLVQL
jgi:succinate dehydrogenase / fumarate reductase cytochrome b subunit